MVSASLEQDENWMRKAIDLAFRGQGHVEPNPMVGCVLVRDNQLVAEGWHQHYGGDHAEVDAIAKAAGSARGATAYVTLEPCCHHGKPLPVSTLSSKPVSRGSSSPKSILSGM